MKTKKTRSTLSRPLGSKPNKSRKKVLIAIILLLILIIIGYLVSARSLPNDATPAKSEPSVVEQTKAAQTASTPEKDVIGNGANSSSDLDESTGISDTETPDDAILNAPLPETDSLAKEEINRLEDEAVRLAEQEQSASEQVTMNKQLTDMKAEQIELLEQQIAKLEADAAGIPPKNTAK